MTEVVTEMLAEEAAAVLENTEKADMSVAVDKLVEDGDYTVEEGIDW